MTDVLSRAKALRAQMLAAVQSKPKAERKARKSSASKSVGTVKAKAAKVAKAIKAADATALSAVAGWQPPVNFSQWLKWHKSGVNLTKVERDRAHVSDWSRIGWDYAMRLSSSVLQLQSKLRTEYIRYVQARFDEPIRWSGTDGNAFDKIVRREAWLERQGKHDLGLLGYSAMDRVQLAVWYATVDRILDWLYQTGASVTPAYIRNMGRALRDMRSDDELRAIAALDGRSRYILSGEHSNGFPRIRKQSQAAEVTKAVRWLELRAEFRELPVVVALADEARAQYKEGEPALPFEYSSFIPSIGDVYKKLKAVQRDGLRAFRNTLEGLTFDGLISDAAQYIAGHRHDLQEAGLDRALDRLDKSLDRLPAEEPLFRRWDFDESYLKRRVVAKVALQQPSYTEASANAKVAMQMLVEGATLSELRDDVFADLSARAFSQLFRDAQVIASDVQETDLFLVSWSQVSDELSPDTIAALME